MTSSKPVDTLTCHTTMHGNAINFLYNPGYVTLLCLEVVPVVFGRVKYMYTTFTFQMWNVTGCQNGRTSLLTQQIAKPVMWLYIHVIQGLHLKTMTSRKSPPVVYWDNGIPPFMNAHLLLLVRTLLYRLMQTSKRTLPPSWSPLGFWQWFILPILPYRELWQQQFCLIPF